MKPLTHTLKKGFSFFSNYLKPYETSDNEWDQFYNRFEDRFRGSAELIGTRLSDRYKKKLKQTIENSSLKHSEVLIDLGCGRGEFLDMAKTLGFQTVGVELSTEAAKIAESHKHEVHVTDIYRFLSQQADASALFISMFHVIEHLPAKYAWKVFRQASRVLKPGGVFLVETPSIFSMWVSGRQFYLDPTHKQPIHPDYLTFMAEDVGLSKSELLEFDEVDRLTRANLAKEASGPLANELERLEKWLYGPMDVACWAVK